MKLRGCLLTGLLFGVVLSATDAPKVNSDNKRPYLVWPDRRFYADVKVIRIEEHQITGENEFGKVVLSVKTPVKVWKCRDALSVKVLALGDKIVAVGTIQPDGTLVPKEITANIERLFGRVVRRSGQRVTVRETNADRTKSFDKVVRLDKRTFYEDGALESDVGPEAQIEVIGCTLADGSVLASRAILYSSGR